mmetsp:Transcript_30720/g.60351  ORF Transcript_30720/g.60351 Transcript_30720/m.60351 type:complete len:271 (-) Transcript_30720:607-1419(-)
MSLQLLKQLHEAKLCPTAHSEVPQGLWVKQLAAHGQICVQCREALLCSPWVAEPEAIAVAMPDLVLIIHHPQQMSPNLVVTDALDHTAGYRTICDVHYVFVVRGFGDIRGGQHAINNPDLHLVCDVVLSKVLGHSVLQLFGRDSLVTVQACHELFRATILVMYGLQDPLRLRQQLKTNIAVFLELGRDLLFGKGIRELWCLPETACPESLHRLMEIGRSQAEQQCRPGLSLFLWGPLPQRLRRFWARVLTRLPRLRQLSQPTLQGLRPSF